MTLDWANLLGGFVLGVAGTVPFWFVDRRHARAATGAEWTRAARRIEFLLWQHETRSAELDALTEELPLDHWRSQLGPSDFRVLESVQVAYWTAEHAASEHARVAADYYRTRSREAPHPNINGLAFMQRVEPERFAGTAEAAIYAEAIAELRTDPAYLGAEQRLHETNRALSDAKVAFANLARARSSGEYTLLVKRERRRAMVRHPWRERQSSLQVLRALRRHRTG